MSKDLLSDMLILKGLSLYYETQSNGEVIPPFYMDDGACKYSLISLVTDALDSSQRINFSISSAYFCLNLERRQEKYPS